MIIKNAMKDTKSIITNIDIKTISLQNKINYMELVQDHINGMYRDKVWIVL